MSSEGPGVAQIEDDWRLPRQRHQRVQVEIPAMKIMAMDDLRPRRQPRHQSPTPQRRHRLVQPRPVLPQTRPRRQPLQRPDDGGNAAQTPRRRPQPLRKERQRPMQPTRYLDDAGVPREFLSDGEPGLMSEMQIALVEIPGRALGSAAPIGRADLQDVHVASLLVCLLFWLR